MRARLVREPVEHPILLEAPDEIGEIAFVPLHAVGKRLWRGGDAGRVGSLNAVFAENDLSDLQRRLVEPDATILPLRGEPEFWPDRERIAAQAARDRRPLVQLGHQPIPRSRALADAEVERQI